MNKEKVSVKVTKTLYFNTYSCTILSEDGRVLAHLKVLPQFPLSREEVPAEAPEVTPYLLVLVEDADINQENLIYFEESVSAALLNRFTTEDSAPFNCRFFYPSPAFFFNDDNLAPEETPLQ